MRHDVQYFVRSGTISFLANGSLRRFGRDGYDWPRSTKAYSSSTSARVYYFGFYPDTVNSSLGPDDRWRGLPVRCLVY